MKKYLGTIGAGYLGFSLSYFAGVNFMTWEFWVIILPTLFLFVADKKLNEE